MKRILTLAALVAAQAACAGTHLTITSNGPARILIDGADAGQAPATLPELPPGFHEIRVESVQTGEARVYDVYSPATAQLHKEVALTFQGVQAAATEEPDAEAPAVDPNAVADEQARIRAAKERDKVRTRNTALGVAVANEIFNKGKSKKAVRGISLGGALLNELIKR